jgi:hypothetical protein
VRGPTSPTVYLGSDRRSYISTVVTVFHTVSPPLPVCLPLSRLVFATNRLTRLVLSHTFASCGSASRARLVLSSGR